MAAPNLALRCVCFVGKVGSDDPGYNPVGAPQARLTIAAALADLAANYPAATAANPHVVSVEPGVYPTPAFALPPNTYICLAHDGPVRPVGAVVLEMEGDITLGAGWAAAGTHRGGFTDITIRQTASETLDFTMPAALGVVDRKLELNGLRWDADALIFSASDITDTLNVFDCQNDSGDFAQTATFEGGIVFVKNLTFPGVLTVQSTATLEIAAQIYGLQITDAAGELVCNAVTQDATMRLGNCDNQNLTLGESGGAIITVYADAPSIPLVANISFTGTAADGDLIRTTDTGAIAGGGGSGDVVGPASSTDKAIARFDGITGKLLADSAVTISDVASNNVTISATTGNAVTIATKDSNKSVILSPHGTGSVVSARNGTAAAVAFGVENPFAPGVVATGFYFTGGASDEVNVSCGGTTVATFQSSGLTIPSLAGVGSRPVLADASGVLSAP